MTFWAHSDRTGLAFDAPGAHWQPLAEHLRNVAALAQTLAEQTSPAWEHFKQLAYWAGLLHDYGKYTDCFQNMIRTGTGRCPHAIHGASMALQTLSAVHIGLAIAGHHAGIPDHGQRFDRAKGNHAEATDLLKCAAAEPGYQHRVSPRHVKSSSCRFEREKDSSNSPLMHPA